MSFKYRAYEVACTISSAVSNISNAIGYKVCCRIKTHFLCLSCFLPFRWQSLLSQLLPWEISSLHEVIVESDRRLVPWQSREIPICTSFWSVIMQSPMSIGPWKNRLRCDSWKEVSVILQYDYFQEMITRTLCSFLWIQNIFRAFLYIYQLCHPWFSFQYG